MSNIISDAKEEIIKLENLMLKINDFLSHAPEGCLKWQNRRGKTYYYQQYIGKEKQADEIIISDENDSSRKWNRKYITKENISFAKALAKKHYYTVLKNIIQKRLKALRKFIQSYPHEEIEAIYDEMCDERKILIESIEITIKEKVKQWQEETYEKNDSYPENLRYETEQGDMVRSKSEVIIANGKEKVIYPDFTIINVHTGKVTYWEHAGLMDDLHYANEFVKKINAYIANNLLPGRDVFLTFEAQGNPLDISVLKRLVKELI